MSRDQAEIDVIQDICKEAKKHEKITGEHLSKLTSLFGQRFLKAWEALKDGKVKKYVFQPSDRVVWIVVGRERDYLVMPSADFCTCDDFYYRIMEKKAHLCYHLIAQKLAECLGWFDKIEDSDELYEVLMKEWRQVIT